MNVIKWTNNIFSVENYKILIENCEIKNKFGSMRGTVLRYIFVSCIEKSRNTIPRYNWDLSAASMFVIEVDKDFFST